MKVYCIFFIAPTLLFGGIAFPQSDTDQLTEAISVTPVYPDNYTIHDVDYWDHTLVKEYIPAADYDKFDLNLTKIAASHFAANFLLSPVALKLALAVLYEASAGATETELEEVLDSDKDRARKKFSRVLVSLESETEDALIFLGSKIYVGIEAEVPQSFTSIVSESYRTEIDNLDFKKPKVAARAINNWVSEKSVGPVYKLTDQYDLAGSSLIVIETLFFTSTWRYLISSDATMKDMFYVAPSLTKKVPFMWIKNNFYYAESTRFDAKIVRIPYKGNKFALYMVVPNTLTGLDRIVKDVMNLRVELLNLQKHLLTIILPKFEFKATYIMNEIFKEMGIRQAFEDTALFFDLNQLKVSKVFHRCGIQVSELGSVRYSVSGVKIDDKFGPNVTSHAEVLANRPFLYFIQDESTKQLLFVGRLSDPTSSYDII